MNARPVFYAMLYGSFWLSIPFFFFSNILPVAIAAIAMFLSTACAARGNRYVV